MIAMIKTLYKVIRKQLSSDNDVGLGIPTQCSEKDRLNKANKVNKLNKAYEQFLNQAQPSLLQELEPRFMFDGAAVEAVDLADGVSEQEQAYILNAIEQNEQAHATESLLQAIEANAENFQTDYSQFREVVIVDARVKDPHILIDSISRTAAIEVILPNQDGVDKIAELLAKYNNLDAIHIISHGDQAKLELGSVDLTTNNLNAYQTQLAQWGQALTEQGDILFYGCNVAEGDAGQAFIEELRALTSADIAASVDITGGEAFAGDSILESDTDVETDEIVDFSEYAHQLAWTLNDNSISVSAAVTAEIALTPDGQTLAVGNQGTSGSEARIYEWDGLTWQQKGSTLVATGQSNFGLDISISDDGARVALGNNGNSGLNYARVYQWNGTDWAQMGSDFPGTFRSVSLNTDGSRLAIGAINNNTVDLYEWNGSSWIQLGSTITHSGEWFGRNVSFNAAGNIVAISAEKASYNGSDSGRLRIYEYDGSNWILKGSPIDGAQAGDKLGNNKTIAMSADGLMVVAPAPANSTNGTSSGMVRVYEWDGSDWAQKGQSFFGSTAYSSLGAINDLSADGMRLFLGDPRANSVGGIIYVYDWDTGSNSWVVSDTIEGNPAIFERFGGSSFSVDQTGERITLVSNTKDVLTYDAPPVPINTLPASIAIDEDSSAFAFTAGDIISVSDPDPTSVLQSVQLTVNFGVLNVSLSVGAAISAGSNNSNTLTIDGNDVDINATLASLTYTCTFDI